MPSLRKSLLATVHQSRRRVGLAMLAIGAIAVGVILGATPTGSSRGANPAARSSGATTVQRRDLIATDTESGTLSYANPQTVFNRLGGTITWLPQVGDVINPGQALYRVDGASVILLSGSVPAYRTLTDGISDGADVKELKRNLKALGFDPDHQITVNDTFDTATTDAIDRWQSSLGETQTGSITLGQVVFLPGAQRITAVDAALGGTGSSGMGSSSGSGAGSGQGDSTGASLTNASTPKPEFVDLTTTTTTPTTTTTRTTTTTPTTTATTPTTTATTPTTTNPPATKKPPGGKRPPATGNGSQQTLSALAALLKAQTQALARAGSSGAMRGGGEAASRGRGGMPSGESGGSVSSSSGAGSGAAGAQPILSTTSTRLIVSVELDATKQTEATVGEPVTVELPSGRTVDGKITKVSPVAQRGSSAGGSGESASAGGGSSAPAATIPVTITLRKSQRVTALDQAAVSVNFEKQVQRNVLSVPVTALLATAGGGYAVQDAAPQHRLIPVTVGLFAAGYVQIAGPAIYSGLQVTDSQG
jgi:hypothetical protein